MARKFVPINDDTLAIIQKKLAVIDRQERKTEKPNTNIFVDRLSAAVKERVGA